MASEYLLHNSATSMLSAQMVTESADYVRSRTAQKVHLALVCGTGMGSLAELLDADSVTSISYADIPHFPQSTVVGHAGTLMIGTLNGVGVFLMQGRFHPYEGFPYWRCAYAVRIMAALGCTTAVFTNAAGGLRRDFQVGDVMLIRDHLNMPGMAGQNPLRGVNDPVFGKRFVAMDDAYNPELLRRVRAIAKGLQIDMKEGVYAMVGGPSFETVAECRALSLLGGDVVGMSTVHEVVVARQCGMNVLSFSLVTNMCVMEYDSTSGSADHTSVMDVASKAAQKIKSIMTALTKEDGGSFLKH